MKICTSQKDVFIFASRFLNKLIYIMENLELESLSTAMLLDLKLEIEAIVKTRESSQKISDRIRIVKSGGGIQVYTYYNEAFVAKARGLKAKWANNCWNFSESVIEHVKNALLDCFGVDGMTPYMVCTLVVEKFDTTANLSGVELFGRPICKAFGRDSGAKPSEDIFFISGEFTSGGSVKNWRTYVNDATFEIHNFPINYGKAEWAELLDLAINEGWVRIKAS